MTSSATYITFVRGDKGCYARAGYGSKGFRDVRITASQWSAMEEIFNQGEKEKC